MVVYIVVQLEMFLQVYLWNKFVCLSVSGAAFIPFSKKTIFTFFVMCLGLTSAHFKVTTDFTLTLKRQLAVKGRDFCAVRKFGFFGICRACDIEWFLFIPPGLKGGFFELGMLQTCAMCIEILMGGPATALEFQQELILGLIIVLIWERIGAKNLRIAFLDLW